MDIKKDLSAAILVGRSTRMGRDKAFLMLGQQTFIGHLAQTLSVCREVIISTAERKDFSEYGLKVIEDPAQVIRHHVFDTRVRGSPDRTRVDHIPHCNLVAQQKCSLLRHVDRYFIVEHCSENFPEPVLGMPVEKGCFPRLYGWKASKDQYCGILPE